MISKIEIFDKELNRDLFFKVVVHTDNEIIYMDYLGTEKMQFLFAKIEDMVLFFKDLLVKHSEEFQIIFNFKIITNSVENTTGYKILEKEEIVDFLTSAWRFSNER